VISASEKIQINSKKICTPNVHGHARLIEMYNPKMKAFT
jgi:hypothetical protein